MRYTVGGSSHFDDVYQVSVLVVFESDSASRSTGDRRRT